MKITPKMTVRFNLTRDLKQHFTLRMHKKLKKAYQFNHEAHKVPS